MLPIVGRDILITGMRLYGIYRGRPMVTSRLAKWKTAVQLFTVIFILFVIGLEEAMGRFAAGHLFFLNDQLIQLLANALLAGGAVADAAVGFSLPVPRDLFLQGTLSAASRNAFLLNRLIATLFFCRLCPVGIRYGWYRVRRPVVLVCTGCFSLRWGR